MTFMIFCWRPSASFSAPDSTLQVIPPLPQKKLREGEGKIVTALVKRTKLIYFAHGLLQCLIKTYKSLLAVIIKYVFEDDILI